VVVDYGRDPLTGKRQRLWRSVRGSKRDAERLLTQLLHEKETGSPMPAKITLGEFLQRWLRDYAEINTAPRTYQSYEVIVRRHLTPALGPIRLSKLRPEHIQHAYREIGAKGVSGVTVLRCHRLLRETLAHAVRWQLIGRNPCDAVDPPRAPRFEPPTVSLDEVRRLLRAADAMPLGTLIYLAVQTGLRRGELIGLRWADIDLGAGILQVRQTVQWLGGRGFVFQQPKTSAGRRAVALSPRTAKRLRAHRQEQVKRRLILGAAWRDYDLVFPNELGGPLDPRNLDRSWHRIRRSAGLEHLRLHDLRHCHASLMLAIGAHPKVVSERLGHSRIDITLDVYSHAMPNLQAEAAAQLDALLGRR
jgi:integrase